MATDPAALVQELTAACELADLPGQAEAGLRRAERAVLPFGPEGPPDARARMLWLRARLSHANHTGNVARADDVWREYERAEPALYALGSAGLAVAAELRNRRAVTLTDQFRHEDAARVLAHVISLQENALGGFAALCGVSRDNAPNFELGACHGTMGQIQAFLGNLAGAQAHFEWARGLVGDSGPAHEERHRVYLGHVACDAGAERGGALWDSVCEGLPELRSPAAVTRAHGQYVLALQLKGLLVFGTSDALRGVLARTDAESALAAYPAEERARHPFGLVLQTFAMLHERLWREEHGDAHHPGLERALANYLCAADHFRTGGPLLQLLAHVAHLRHQLLLHAAHPDDPERRLDLGDGVRALKTFAEDHFGAPAWGEGERGQASGYLGGRDPGPAHPWEARVRAILAAIRFNYW